MDRAQGLGQDVVMRRARVVARGTALRRGLALAAGAVLAFAAVTLVALESGEVVVLRTRAVDGSAHATRTWIADADGAAWVEAANPERPFLHDLGRAPTLVLDRHGRAQSCRATVAANPAGHERIRALLAAKYGWADCWIALVADTRRSLAVRLDCDDAAHRGTQTG